MYIPKSQIQTGLSTPGSQLYVVSTGKDYTGNYWKKSNNQMFSGLGPSDPSSEEIRSYASLHDDKEFIKKYGEEPDGHDYLGDIGIAPSSSPPLPTPSDYTSNTFERYFIRRVNQPIFVEIDSKLYSQFESNSPEVPYTIYIWFKMPWLISGDKEHVRTSNNNIVLLREQNLQVYGLQEFLQEDYLQYYKE